MEIIDVSINTELYDESPRLYSRYSVLEKEDELCNRTHLFVLRFSSDSEGKTAGQPDPSDHVKENQEHSQSESKWHGNLGVEGEYSKKDNKASIHGSLSAKRDNLTVTGKIGLDNRGDISAGGGLDLEF